MDASEAHLIYAWHSKFQAMEIAHNLNLEVLDGQSKWVTEEHQFGLSPSEIKWVIYREDDHGKREYYG